MGGNSTDKPTHSLYLSEESENEDSHKITSSLFTGPQTKNIDYFKKNVSDILDAHADARQNYNPSDGVSSTLGSDIWLIPL